MSLQKINKPLPWKSSRPKHQDARTKKRGNKEKPQFHCSASLPHLNHLRPLEIWAKIVKGLCWELILQNESHLKLIFLRSILLLGRFVNEPKQRPKYNKWTTLGFYSQTIPLFNLLKLNIGTIWIYKARH